MNTKLLIAILAGVISLVAIGYYFVHEDMLEKQKEEEIRKRRNEVFDATELWEKAKDPNSN